MMFLGTKANLYMMIHCNWSYGDSSSHPISIQWICIKARGIFIYINAYMWDCEWECKCVVIVPDQAQNLGIAHHTLDWFLFHHQAVFLPVCDTLFDFCAILQMLHSLKCSIFLKTFSHIEMSFSSKCTQYWLPTRISCVCMRFCYKHQFCILLSVSRSTLPVFSSIFYYSVLLCFFFFLSSFDSLFVSCFFQLSLLLYIRHLEKLSSVCVRVGACMYFDSPCIIIWMSFVYIGLCCIVGYV